MRSTPEPDATELVSVDDVEPGARGGDAARSELTTPLGTTDVAINHYWLGPDERAAGLHAHADQEEVFLVVDGAATFETLDGEVVVDEDAAIRFAPGELHSGAIAIGSPVTVLALGAPPDSEDVRIPLPCPECGRDDGRAGPAADGETPVLVCPNCGAEADATCSTWGDDDVHAELAEDGDTPVGVCRSCGAVANG